MTYEQYEAKAAAIDAWAGAAYRKRQLTEAQIERRVEAMFDALDDEYMPSRHAGFTGSQSLSDFVEDAS